MKKRLLSVVAGCTLMGAAAASDARAVGLSIFDIQSNTSDGDASIYNGQIQDVIGGVVTYVWHGFNDRVYLQDPGSGTWGGIVVKDGEGGELANHVSVGDWVSFGAILIEEYRGTTFLQYRRSFAPNVSFTIESSGNVVPSPAALSAADLPVPVDHAASEPYESMLVSLGALAIGTKDLGKAGDNYELWQGGDVAWGSDYMNMDAGAPYDPRIVTGAAFSSITGLLEQYTKESDGWDYYQLLTRSASDIVPEPATGCLLATGVGVMIYRRRGRRAVAARSARPERIRRIDRRRFDGSLNGGKP